MTITRVRGSFKPKRVTRVLLEQLFNGAHITGGAGHFRVTTPHGAVTISHDKINLRFGGADLYQGAVLLVRECWGAALVRGSREAMLACVAHGEALDADIQADMRSRWALAWRWFVAASVVYMGFRIWPQSENDPAGLAIIVAALLIFSLLKFMAKRTEQKKREKGGYLYPRQCRGTGEADEKALREAGLI
jgi:hypothetical protein